MTAFLIGAALGLGVGTVGAIAVDRVRRKQRQSLIDHMAERDAFWSRVADEKRRRLERHERPLTCDED